MKSPEINIGVPKTPEQKKSKIFISEEWTTEERESLVELMNEKVDELNAEEKKMRETIKWEAPCFKEIKDKKESVQDLIDKLDSNTPSEFLEKNRQNFKEFVLHI
ncbi:hypothetical protein KAJ61_04835 [Candidatus Parcubacteria bacterium]|nr:hypothetical protein [Candidatus Parcubacteria bacterium]